MNKKILYGLLLFATTIVGFSSCSDDDDSDPVQPPVSKNAEGLYVLNSGRYKNNSASVAYYNIETGSVDTKAFESANGVSLGDTGQDMVVYGNKMYIGVYNSGVIYVTDKNCKILATIKDDSQKLQPRSFDVSGGKVYVTLFDGYLARIDTTTMAIDKKIEVGPNPEGVKVVNQKIYVANSGGLNSQNGYNNTVSIVDLDLTSKKDIEVVPNPTELELDKYNNLYLVSRGNYGYATPVIPYTLQQINTSTDEVSVLNEGDAYSVYADGDKLYMLDKKYDASGTPSSTFMYYDIINKKVVDQSFITDGTTIKDASYLAIDPATKNFYLTVADGDNNGDVYIFSSEGKLKSTFDTGSAYPVKISFINK